MQRPRSWAGQVAAVSALKLSPVCRGLAAVCPALLGDFPPPLLVRGAGYDATPHERMHVMAWVCPLGSALRLRRLGWPLGSALFVRCQAVPLSSVPRRTETAEYKRSTACPRGRCSSDSTRLLLRQPHPAGPMNECLFATWQLPNWEARRPHSQIMSSLPDSHIYPVFISITQSPSAANNMRRSGRSTASVPSTTSTPATASTSLTVMPVGTRSTASRSALSAPVPTMRSSCATC